MQTVTVAGQVIQVGASAPSLSWSGPGEIDLFGQSLPTDLRFTGPVRPRLQLSQITINSELTTLIEGHRRASAETHTRRPPCRRVETLLRLGDGDRRGWHAAPGGGGRGLAPSAVTAPRSSCSPPGCVVAEAINLGAIMVTTYTAPALLRQVHSLNDLVGSETHAAADPPDRPAAAPGAGRGHRGLHRGGRRARPVHRRVRYRPGLRAQRRLLRGRPVRRQRLAGAQPRLRQRHHQPRAARAAAARRASAAAAARGGGTGHERIGHHRQRRRRRPELGRDGALLRGHADTATTAPRPPTSSSSSPRSARTTWIC